MSCDHYGCCLQGWCTHPQGAKLEMDQQRVFFTRSRVINLEAKFGVSLEKTYSAKADLMT